MRNIPYRKLANHYPNTVFWLGIVILSIVYSYPSILGLRPQSSHYSRQSDCASYALNYYQLDNDFFEPITHTLTGNKGRAASEFPIIYYGASKLYKVFGPKEGIIRIINLLLFFMGLFALFKTGRILFKDKLKAFLAPLLVFTSPYIVYYANNFLPNVAALSLGFIAWWAFFTYREREEVSYIYILSIVFLSAGLLKVSALISYVVILLIWGMEASGFGFGAIRRKHIIHKVLGLGIVMIGVIAWYRFAQAYNIANGTGQNLIGIIPIWEMGFHDILATCKILCVKWAIQFQSPPTLILLLWLLWRLIRKGFHHAVMLRHIVLWLLLGAFAYVMLWFDAFYHHDYYLINVFILPVFILMYSLKNHTFSYTKNEKLFICALVFISIIHTGLMQHVRYHGWLYETCNTNLYEISPHLRSMGVKSSDIVVSVPDETPNGSLYMMNNRGWTEAFNSDSYNITWFQKQGAKYLIINDSSYLDKELYRPFLSNPIGSHNGVYVFDIRRD